MNTITVNLTKSQQKRLQSLDDEATRSAFEGERGMIVAQVYPELGWMRVGFVSEKTAIAIKATME